MIFDPYLTESISLAPYAVFSKNSIGRKHSENFDLDNRTCFQRDRDRIVHSASFRRLNGKTQVFLANTCDHYRSRLTHSIEVSQVSRHLSRLLKLNEDLSECIALAHDLGHTPFGHAGERMLNKLMTAHGGFEHNLQSRRVVEQVESKYPKFDGLNLSIEILDGLLKHQTPWDHPTKSVGFISIEAQVVNLADEITYNNHDIDDGLSSGILSEDELIAEVSLYSHVHDSISKQYENLSFLQRKHSVNRALISFLINDVYEYSSHLINKYDIVSLQDVQSCKFPLISFSPAVKEQCLQLRKFLFHKFYRHSSISEMNIQGKNVIAALFQSFESNPNQLPSHILKKVEKSSFYQTLADYISGMTDNFALRVFNQL